MHFVLSCTSHHSIAVQNVRRQSTPNGDDNKYIKFTEAAIRCVTVCVCVSMSMDECICVRCFIFTTCYTLKRWEKTPDKCTKRKRINSSFISLGLCIWVWDGNLSEIPFAEAYFWMETVRSALWKHSSRRSRIEQG